MVIVSLLVVSGVLFCLFPISFDMKCFRFDGICPIFRQGHIVQCAHTLSKQGRITCTQKKTVSISSASPRKKIFGLNGGKVSKCIEVGSTLHMNWG